MLIVDSDFFFLFAIVKIERMLFIKLSIYQSFHKKYFNIDNN